MFDEIHWLDLLYLIPAGVVLYLVIAGFVAGLGLRYTMQIPFPSF